MIIRAVNNLDSISPYSQLANPTAIGAGTFTVKNINSFNPSYGVQIGKTGEEQSEVLILSSGAISGSTVVATGTARFPHPENTPIYSIRYDQIVFERSTAGTAGTASPMTNGTVTITPDSPYTYFDDATGALTYAYRSYFRNSVSGDVTAESDWMTPDGLSFYSLGRIRDRIKRKLMSSNYIKDDQTIDDWVNEWLETMNNTIIDVNKDYAMGSTSVAYAAGAERGTITASDFKEARRLWFTYNGSDYYLMRKMAITGYSPQDTFNDTHPYFYYAGDNVIGRKPAETAGTASIEYYKIPTQLDNDTDELSFSMRAYTKTFVDYALSQAYYLDEKNVMGDKFLGEANAGMEKFRLEMTPRSKTGPQFITTVEALDGEDNMDLLI